MDINEQNTISASIQNYQTIINESNYILAKNILDNNYNLIIIIDDNMVKKLKKAHQNKDANALQSLLNNLVDESSQYLFDAIAQYPNEINNIASSTDIRVDALFHANNMQIHIQNAFENIRPKTVDEIEWLALI